VPALTGKQNEKAPAANSGTYHGFSTCRLKQDLSRNARAAGFDQPVASPVSAASANARDLDRASDVINAPEDVLLKDNISMAKKHSANFTESKFDFL
jgi:hypothetical protein